jgi:hypothetical protein
VEPLGERRRFAQLTCRRRHHVRHRRRRTGPRTRPWGRPPLGQPTPRPRGDLGIGTGGRHRPPGRLRPGSWRGRPRRRCSAER